MPNSFKKFLATLSVGEKFNSGLNFLLAICAILLAFINIAQLLLGKTPWLNSEMLQSATLMIIGVVIVYFLTNEYFQFKRNNFESHRITELGEVLKKFPLDDLFKKAQAVDILTASNLRFFGDGGAHLLEIARRRNIKCRFISLDPNSEASHEFLANKSPNIYRESDRQDKLVIPCIDRQYFNLNPWFSQNVEYYLTHANIPFSIMIFRDEKGVIFFLKVDFYAIEIGSATRPCMYFLENDVAQLKLFESQFELILQRKSTPYFINGTFNEDLWLMLNPDKTASPTGTQQPAEDGAADAVVCT